jgi:DNA-binding FadR family transcriptional regulator
MTLDGNHAQMHQKRERAEFACTDLKFLLVPAKATGNPVIIKVDNVLRSILEVSMENIVNTLGMDDGLRYHRQCPGGSTASTPIATMPRPMAAAIEGESYTS